MPKRKIKKYSKPQKPFDKIRISEENELKERYGLKNKREIWKADAAVRRIRNLAKQLITKSDEEKKAFVSRLQKKGFEVNSIADALALDKEDWLKRRLQTIVYMKKLANTAKQARQLVVHKHVSVGKRIINIPSYQVTLEEEPDMELNIVLKIKKKKDKVEEIKKEIGEEIQEETAGSAEEIAEETAGSAEEIAEEIAEAEKEIAEEVAEIEEKVDKGKISQKKADKEINEEIKEIAEETSEEIQEIKEKTKEEKQ